MKPDAIDNLLSALTVGGRLNPERSYAKKSYQYSRGADSGVKFERERGGMKRDIDEVEALLDLWADWMRKPEPIAEGYPEKASGGFIPSWCKDTEEAAEAADAETIARVNAAFDSLQRIYQEAINKHYGLGHQVWRFAKDANFEDAKIVIRVKFVAKGLL